MQPSLRGRFDRGNLLETARLLRSTRNDILKPDSNCNVRIGFIVNGYLVTQPS